MTRTRILAIAALFVALVSTALPGLAQEEQLPTLKLDRVPALPAFAGQTRAPQSDPSEYKVETVVGGLSAPWALAFMPDGDILITENTGQLRIVDPEGVISPPLTGLPEMSHQGWAGLFDLTLDPNFADNEIIYFSYVAPGSETNPNNVARVARARLNADRLHVENVQVLVDGFGGQELHVAPDGSLLVAGASEGKGEDPQDTSVMRGKLLRINTDGSVPHDNPFVDSPGARPEIYTVGHRDVSGIATHPETGDIWITEHGPRGGDELNRIAPGRNYGWELISYGTNYDGEPVGDGQSMLDGMEQPRYFWRPSIAPSGLAFYTGDMFPEWQGSVFVTSLSGQHVTRLALSGDKVVSEERLLLDRNQRVRELRVGSDGALYVLTNEDSGAPKGTAEMLRISRAD